MKAQVGETLIAEASTDDLVRIEGNWYFPPSSIVAELLTKTPTQYTCPWKGACQYFTITVDGETITDGAWSYPEILPTAVERVGRDFAGYVAFGNRVRVTV